MADSEGSVFVEGIDTEVEDESTETSESTENQESESSTESSQEDTQEAEDNKGTAPEKTGEPKLTDKGTKLDENPQSRVHQELANAKRDLKNYEAFLKSPEAIQRYLEQNGYSKAEAKEASKPEPLMKIDVSKLQTAEDVAEAFNSLQTAFLEKLSKSEETTSKLMKDLQSLTEGRKVEQLGTRMRTDIADVRSKYPELDPKSGEGVYNSELEKDIAELYHELDFDEEVGGYRGKISLAQITDRVMKAAYKARKQGSEDAKTQIRVKSSGKVVTSSKSSTGKADESATPELTIASRVSQALNKKG